MDFNISPQGLGGITARDAMRMEIERISDRIKESKALPFIELEDQNLMKLLGKDLFSNVNEIIKGNKTLEEVGTMYKAPSLSKLWNNTLLPNLKFRVGVNPYPGYELNISKGRGGLGRKPSQYATNIQKRPYDWKVDLKTPMPEWMSEIFY